MRLLLVEDDADLAARLSRRLTSAGYAVDIASDGPMALDWPDLGEHSVIILDLGLPGIDGLSVLRQWRARGVRTPIIVLTARGSWQEKVEGLNAGADDFVVKPVHSEELIARIHAQIRRVQDRGAPTLMVNDLTLDPVAHTASRAGAALDLSRQEFRLLETFMRRPGSILSQGDLLERLYPLGAERDWNALEVQVSRLRRKLGGPAITTVRGLGYRLDR
ncbi:response regulator transcription factor [Polymorphobacter multimanifer]|uniref:Two-component system OmpR family response regulator n=1 Tax=Polymorphobacter multimanifer TaxID=1070431 RepID=A0A841L314_9SPHN|nr:response regulator transcription factor [Polymorphobacter multimanifer]MBB6227229.1 two-component system OmpR family response regulator [Polymorphobacter multimanifer]